MPTKKYVASSSAVGPNVKSAFRQSYSRKPIDKLNEREFRERFYFPNDISVWLVDGDAMNTEKAAHNAIYFSKSSSMRGFVFLFRLFSKNSSTTLRFLQLTSIPISFRC